MGKSRQRIMLDIMTLDLRALPGGDLVEEGLSDLAWGIESIPALLVL